MASISANGSRGNHKFTLTVNETDYSTANNTSTVDFVFVLSPVVATWDWYNHGNDVSYTVTISGTNYTGIIPAYDGVSSVTIKSGTQTVSHNADGTKTIDFGFSVKDVSGKTYTSGDASANGTLTLTNIVIAPSTYTIHFDGNGATGGNMEDITMTYNIEDALPPNGFSRNDYDFVGWASFPTCNAIYEDGATVINLSSGTAMTLYAIWKHTLFNNKKAYIKTSDGVKSYRTMVFDGANWLYYKSNIRNATNTITEFILDSSSLDDYYAVLG